MYALFFVFVSLAPYAFEALNLPPDRFGVYYLFLATGFFVGNLLVSRSGDHHDMVRQIHAGLWWQMWGASIALGMVAMGYTHPLAIFMPMMLFSFGQGLSLPNLIAHGIRLAPNSTGVASSIFGFSQMALSAVAVQAMGYLPFHGWRPALWFCAIGAVVTMIGVRRLEMTEVSPSRA